MLDFSCNLHNNPRKISWCEEHCVKYFNCDTVAEAISLESEQEQQGIKITELIAEIKEKLEKEYEQKLEEELLKIKSELPRVIR